VEWRPFCPSGVCNPMSLVHWKESSTTQPLNCVSSTRPSNIMCRLVQEYSPAGCPSAHHT
jgi:hypothetical protein